MKKIYKESRGVTLAALIVTIVILIILSSIGISLVVKDYRTVDDSKEMVAKQEKNVAKKELEILLLQYKNKVENGNIESLRGYLISQGATSVENSEMGYIIEYKGYQFTINKDDYTINNIDIAKLGPELSITVGPGETSAYAIITAKVTNAVNEINSIVLIDSLGTEYTMDLRGKTATYTVSKNGKYSVKATAIIDGNEKSTISYIEVNQIPVTFSTTYGRIEVIWLDKDNNVIDKPLSPVLGNGMTGVYWDNDGNEINISSDNKNNWYNYQSIIGPGNNTTSKWANAIDSNGSYFVWIPRYAYRITYYSSESLLDVTGYCDGHGIRTVTGEIKYALDDGIETVEYNGSSYIVHPAFETNLNMGGWNSNLDGFWIAKYEGSDDGNGNLSSLPNKKSYRMSGIEKAYMLCINYNPTNNSHLIKMSEWGAVAYLTHSQYGRNGQEISANTYSYSYNSTLRQYTMYTAGSSTEGNYKNNVAQSSTGNVYGVYDLSGGLWEYTSAYNIDETDTYKSSFWEKSKFVTPYSNSTSSSYENGLIYQVGKIGDATKEVSKGASTSKSNWFSNRSEMLDIDEPWIIRGGYGKNNNIGIFAVDNAIGYYQSNISQDHATARIVLCP